MKKSDVEAIITKAVNEAVEKITKAAETAEPAEAPAAAEATAETPAEGGGETGTEAPAEGTQEAIDAAAEAIKSGELHVFAGPLKGVSPEGAEIEVAEGDYFHEQEEASAPAWSYIVEGCNVAQ